MLKHKTCHTIIEELKILIDNLDELEIIKIEKVLGSLKDEIISSKKKLKHDFLQGLENSPNPFVKEQIFETPIKHDEFETSKL